MPPYLSQLQLSSCTPNSSTHLKKSRGNGGLWSVHDHFSVSPLPLHASLPTPAWGLHRLQLLQEIPSCSSMGVLHRLHCGYLFHHGASPLTHLTLMFSLVFLILSLFFFHLLFPCSLPVWCFLIFLKYVFTEVSLPWLMGSVMSCGGSVGPSWNDCVWHRAGPDLFPQRPPP